MIQSTDRRFIPPTADLCAESARMLTFGPDDELRDHVYTDLLRRCPMGQAAARQLITLGATDTEREVLRSAGYGQLPNQARRRVFRQIAAHYPARLLAQVPGFDCRPDGTGTVAGMGGALLVPITDDLGRIGAIRAVWTRCGQVQDGVLRGRRQADFDLPVHTAGSPDSRDPIYLCGGEIEADLTHLRLKVYCTVPRYRVGRLYGQVRMPNARLFVVSTSAVQSLWPALPELLGWLQAAEAVDGVRVAFQDVPAMLRGEVPADQYEPPGYLDDLYARAGAVRRPSTRWTPPTGLLATRPSTN